MSGSLRVAVVGNCAALEMSAPASARAMDAAATRKSVLAASACSISASSVGSR